MPIDEIAIESVRGVRAEIKLSLHGKSLIVRGDNGTGKSSIVQALAWALTGTRAQEANLAHVLDVGKSRVSISFKDGSSLDVSEKKVKADERGVAVRAACQKANPFLVRKQLLGILDQTPAARFKYLEGFLDLEVADQLFEALTRRTKEAEDDVKGNQAEVDRLLVVVQERLPKSYRPQRGSWATVSKALVTWAASEGVQPQPNTWEDLKTAMGPLKSLLTGEALARRRNAIENSLGLLREFTGESAPDDPVHLLTRLSELEAAATDAQSVGVLEQAVTYLERKSDAASCPVCEQPIVANNVRFALRRRLEGLQKIQSTRDRIGLAVDAWRSRGSRLRAALASAMAALDVAAKDASDRTETPPHAQEDFGRPGDSREELVARLAGALAQEQRAVEFCRERLNAELAALPGEAAADAQRAVLDAIEVCAERELAISLAEQACDASRKLATDLRTLSESLRAARQDVARELLQEISQLVGDYYSRIHPSDSPDEVTGEPRIEVQRHAGGTALLRGQFNKKNIDDPRRFYSDGHLDTVGICVFLALRRFRANRDGARDPHLMVLDDIVLSVDLGHARRFLDLLRDEFRDHQVLMFTHNGLFYDWCITRLATYERRVIQRWTLETGPLLGDYLSAMDRLRKSIETETSSKVLGQAAMNLMDEWLADARFELRLAIPAQRCEQYTLTDIWQKFASTLRSSEKSRTYGSWLGEVSRLLDQLEDLPRMRNSLAAHENEFAREFPLSVLREMALRCVQLVEALYCRDCRRFAEYLPNPDEPEKVRCRCERIRYVRPEKAPKPRGDGAAK